MFSFILASTRDAWADIEAIYTPIADRFPIKLDLTGNPQRMEEVIANYLESARPEDSAVTDRWYPFRDDAVSRLIELRGNILRHVLTECRHLIDVGIEKQVSAPLSPEFVEENLSYSIDHSID